MRTPLGRPWWGIALLALIALVGCDDDPAKPTFSISFVTPQAGQSLTCVDDLDKATPNTVEYDVEGLVILKSSSADGLSARLQLGTDLERVMDVPDSGRVLFEGVPFPEGPAALRLELLDGGADAGGGELLAEAALELGVNIDTSDPACRDGQPDPSLSFVEPASGVVFTEAEDGDETLTNGLQVTARLALENVEGAVSVRVDGGEAQQVQALGAMLEVPITLEIGDGARTSHTISAAFGDASAEVEVFTEVSGCQLTLEPRPTGEACDLTAADDLDPETAGVQVSFTARTNCTDVTFTQGGDDVETVGVVDGRASVILTFEEGEVSVGARAATPGGVTGEVEAYTLVVASQAPAVAMDLTDFARNDFDLSDAFAADEGAVWRFTGTAEGLSEGDDVAVALEPAVDGAAATIQVGADGALTFDLEVEAWCGTLTISADHPCGGRVESPAYEICVDGVQAHVDIRGPADGAQITAELDTDPEREGHQIEAFVTVTDARAEADYEVWIECRRADEEAFETKSDAPVMRSALSGGSGDILVSFDVADAGEWVCRPAAEDSPNPPTVGEKTWTISFTTPTFQLQSPAAGEPACVTAETLDISGVGGALDENGAVLRATLTPDGGEALDPIPLEGEGEGRYAARFGEGGSEVPADGLYEVQVEGEIQGGLAIEVSPEEAPSFILDTTPPTLALASPAADAPLGVEADANGDLADCVQTTLSFTVEDANPGEVCYQLNGAAERCVAVVDGAAETEAVDLIRGDNALTAFTVDCAGHRQDLDVTLVASDECPPPILVIDPVSNSRVSLEAHDLDPATADVLDIDVTLSAGLPEGTEVEVLLDGDGVFGPAGLDAQGQAVIRVQVPVGGEPLQAFTLQGRAGANSGPIANITLVTGPSTLVIEPPAGCVNAQVADASDEAGFQMDITARSGLVLAGNEATLSIDCGAGPIEVMGAVADNGDVSFTATLPEEATCALTASVPDGAGRTAEAEAVEIQIDRVAPTITFNRPEDGAVLTEISDENPEREGLQLTPSLRVCGAPNSTLTVTSDIFDGPQAVELDDLPGGCEQVLLDQRTLPLGDVQIDAQVADACGNDTTVTVNAEADAGANAIIVDPADGATILVVDDDDDQAAGCQFDLQAISTGLDGAAEVEVCTSVEGGSQSELCGQRYVANAAPCVLNEDASNIRCPISLTDGVHDLIIAARFGDRITSEEISVRADCTAPSVTSVTVDEAGDSCVNRAERANPGSAGDQAAVTVSVVVDGVEDGQELALRARPDARFLGTIAINGGEGQLVINLQPGEHALYVTGRDEAGNNLPSEPLVEAIIRVDTVVAAPQILNLVADACLNAAMDEDAGGAAGLQYTIQLQPGGEVDEVVTSALRVDGGEIGNNTGAEALLEVTATLAEGAHDVSATVTDECGNVGQVAATAFRVDTIAPTLVIDAPSEGQTFAEGDDANADPNDGFQVAARVTPSELEDGQEVRLFSGNSRLGTDPARLLASGAALDATLTLSPGPHSLTARATDTCGNASTSEAVNVTVEIDGCTSRLTSFASEPQVYGPGDGVVDGQSLRIDVTAEVDLLDLNCANGTATLLLDGAPLGAGVLVDDGQIQMSGVAIPHGEHTLALRVDLDGTQTLSANQTVVVDLESPAASITAPTGDVTQDTNLGEDGQQVAVRVEVTEGSIDSARTAQLYINGAESGAPVAVGAGSPAIVSFNNTTIPAGSVTLRVCVTDEAGNEGCDEEIINADPSAPGGLTLNVTITDARRTAIQLDFTAPGDDGAGGGPVTAYELRRSDAPITDANWAAAEVLTRFTQGLVDPGQAQTLDYEGLALNEMHHLGLRAFDDLDRGGPVASGEADLSLNEVVFQLDGPDGWDVNNLGNNQSAIQRLGSVDGDAFDDILVVATAAGVSVAGVIFGADNADDGVVTPIAVPAGIAFLSLGAGIGDVNGDGIPDFALGGLTATFDGTLVSVYLGCDTSAGCARGDIVTPDATISTTAVFPDPARFLNNIIGVGDFDGGGFNDIFLGGSLAGNGTEAFVVSGRSTQDWTGATIDLDSDASVTTLNVPGGTFTGAAAVEVDGHILLSTGQAAAAQVWRFTGPAAAAAEVIHPCPGGTPWFGSYMAGGVDLDGDGDADALVGDRNSKRIVSFEGSGAGGSQCFGMSPSLDLFGFVFDTAGDVNGDGAVDVIVTHQETATTTDAFILYNDGAGGFGQGAAIDRLPDVRLSLPADAWKLGVAGIGSFNAGSEDDFAVASPATNAIQITVYY